MLDSDIKTGATKSGHTRRKLKKNIYVQQKKENTKKKQLKIYFK